MDACEPRQVRKEAAISGNAHVPQASPVLQEEPFGASVCHGCATGTVLLAHQWAGRTVPVARL